MKKSDIHKIIREEFVNILREETMITETFQDPIARMLAKDRNLENNWFKFFNAMSRSFDIAWDKDDLSKKPYILEFSPRFHLTLQLILNLNFPMVIGKNIFLQETHIGKLKQILLIN